MSAKHFVNDPIHAVVTALKSLTLTNPSLGFDEPNKVLYRHPASIENSSDKVSIISGGGSGHEPGWVGYVGKGVLTACVAGTIFASPSASQVQACIAHRLPKDSKGILVLVMNYTGDVLNFGVGAEKARATGKEVEMVILGDDVGVGREKGGKVGRRGIAGATFAIKVCGALAEAGGSLEEVAHVGRVAGSNVVSVAASLSRVHVPGRPVKDAEEEAERLPLGTCELGMGIHNEPGCEKLETDLPGTVKKMLAQLLDQGDEDRAYLGIGRTDQVVMLVNNFGGLSNLELGAITWEVWTQLTGTYGIKPIRVFAGVFNGSLNGLGFGVSLLKLADTGLGPGKTLLELVDAPCEVIGWPAPIDPSTWDKSFPEIKDKEEVQEEEDGTAQAGPLEVDPPLYTSILRSGLQRLLAAESSITHYDSLVGDGDCGTGLARGARALLAQLDSQHPASSNLLRNLTGVIHSVEQNMDGTSGALYAIFLNSLASQMRLVSPDSPTEKVDASFWAEALRGALDSLGRYTPARPGDRTLIDALEPFVLTLSEKRDLRAAAQAAANGAQNTVGMKPGLGRSVYVGGDDWKKVPDPGAYGLAELLLGMADGIPSKEGGGK